MVIRFTAEEILISCIIYCHKTCGCVRNGARLPPGHYSASLRVVIRFTNFDFRIKDRHFQACGGARDLEGGAGARDLEGGAGAR